MKQNKVKIPVITSPHIRIFPFLSLALFLGMVILNFSSIADPVNTVDSLQEKLKNAKACLKPCLGDTARVNTLNELAWELMYSNPDTALLVINEALKLSEAIPENKGKMGTANLLRTSGSLFDLKGNYENALNNYFASLKICEEINAVGNSE